MYFCGWTNFWRWWYETIGYSRFNNRICCKNNKITTSIIRCRPYSPHSLLWRPYWVSYPRYFVVYRRQKCVFLSFIDDNMASYLRKRGICEHKNTYKDGKYRRWAWENPYCLWRQDPSRLIPNTQGCFLLNSYVSDSYALFRLIFTLLRTWASGTLKTWVDSCFYCSNGCRRAYFSLSMQSNDPTKLRIFFGISSLFSSFFARREGRRRVWRRRWQL